MEIDSACLPRLEDQYFATVKKQLSGFAPESLPKINISDIIAIQNELLGKFDYYIPNIIYPVLSEVYPILHKFYMKCVKFLKQCFID